MATCCRWPRPHRSRQLVERGLLVRARTPRRGRTAPRATAAACAPATVSRAQRCAGAGGFEAGCSRPSERSNASSWRARTKRSTSSTISTATSSRRHVPVLLDQIEHRIARLAAAAGAAAAAAGVRRRPASATGCGGGCGRRRGAGGTGGAAASGGGAVGTAGAGGGGAAAARR